ncbi:MAG: dihydroorotase [Candidatus Nitrospinota bacterium M3_3B_026]
MSDLLIKNGRVIDPANGIDGVMDVLIEKGRIAVVDKDIPAEDRKVIDASGKWVTPGLVDIHVHLREPGQEHKETIETGTRAAAAAGFTSIACMANTDPVNDNASVTDYILETARAKGAVNVHVIGAVTQGLAGERLADIGEMAERGAVAVSDDGRAVMNGYVLRRAMEYASMFGLVVIEHAEDHALAAGGVMNEGEVSARLGLRGRPAAAEDIIVARDAAVAEYLGAPIHIAHVSTAGAVQIIRGAKERGVQITAEAAPHHFTLTDEACLGYDTMAKVAPPLRTAEDVEAIRAGLADGTIDLIATDHAPHNVADKETEFDNAAFGISGLETALALSLALVRDGTLTPSALIEAMTVKPAGIIGIDRGSLSPGAAADITIMDPEAEWVVDPAKFFSRGKNTPFAGRAVKGRAAMTIVKGKVVHEIKGEKRG